MTRAVGYVRRSTSHQDLTLDVQRESIEAACKARGWDLVLVESDDASGKSADRPGLQRALDALEAGSAEVLVTAKLDRLSRSVIDLGHLLERAKRGGWNLVALDLGLDLGTPAGELTAHVLGAVAQWERRTISDRTRAALRSLPRERRNGRPCYSEHVRARARELRSQGHTLRQVAQQLTAEGVRPPRGGTGIGPSTVLRLLEN